MEENHKNELIFDSAFRTNYSNSIDNFINSISKKTSDNRDKYLYLGEKEKRNELKKILGFPLLEKKWKAKVIQKEEIYRDETYVAKKYVFYINEIEFGGILYENPTDENNDNCALVFALHGGDGSAEVVGDLFIDSANYNNMVKRVLQKNIKVFAPQLLLWHKDIYGSPYDRQKVNNRLTQLGGSITALELKLLISTLSYFESYCDKGKMGVIGLSYGGMYSLYFGALDKRLKAVYSSCWFSDRAKHCWNDWTYFNAENKFFDTEVASLVLPRKLFIEVGESDFCFPAKDGEKERERLKNYAIKENCLDKLEMKVFSGSHELDKNNEMIERFKKYILNLGEDYETNKR